MPDKKLTDKEIVKALEDLVKCNNNEIDCGNCTLSKFYPRCPEEIGELALDLINRSQAENDNYSHNNRTMTKDILDLQKENEELRVTIKAFTDIGKLYSEIKSEAYNECIEKVKEVPVHYQIEHNGVKKFVPFIDNNDLDNLLKELVGE